MTTRILHVSDTHIDNWQYKNDQRREDLLDAFNQAISIAIEEDVDAVVHTGDLYDDPNPHSTALVRTGEIVERLAEHDIPFYAIVGNHERKRGAQWLDLIAQNPVASRLDKQSTPVGDDVELYGIDALTQTEWETTDEFILEETADDRFSILCMHELVAPPVPDSFKQHIPEQVYTAQEIFDKLSVEPDGIALGDYHERSIEYVDGTPLWYPGSTEKLSVSEGDTKSVALLEFDGDGTFRFEERELDTRDFVTITVPVTGSLTISTLRERVEEYGEQVEGAVVTVEFTGDEAPPFNSKQVRTVLRQEGALIGFVSDKTEQEEITNDGSETVSTQSVQSIDAVVSQKVESLALSEATREIDEIARNVEDGPQTKKAIRSRADEVMETHAPETATGGDSP